MLVERRRLWWLPWLIGGFFSSIYLAMGFIQPPQDRINLLLQAYALFWLLNLPDTLSGPLYIFHRTQLMRFRFGMTEQVPLARATAKQKGRRWEFRWKEGRVGKSLSLTLSPAFSEAVERVLAQQAQAAPTAPPPDEEILIRQPWQAPFTLWAYVAAITTLMVLALVFNHPWWLVPIGIIIPLAALFRDDAKLLLTSEGIWVVHPGRQEPYLVPLAAIQAVEEVKRKPLRIMTTDARYPEIKVPLISAQDGLPRLLWRLLAGEPALTKAIPHPSSPPAPAPQVLRCTLCGRPVAELPADANPDSKAVQICELCGGKARVEAAETGHGLTAKEQRPL